jgi:hypothetical protein
MLFAVLTRAYTLPPSGTHGVLRRPPAQLHMLHPLPINSRMSGPSKALLLLGPRHPRP